MSSRKEEKLRARAARLAYEAELRSHARRKRRLTRAAAAVGVIAGVAITAIVVTVTGSGQARTTSARLPRLASPATLGRLRSAGPLGPGGPEGVPVPGAPDLAGTGSGAPAGPVDGIECLGSEQLLFHIHAHLAVYVDGRARRIPYGIGIRGAQAMWTPAGTFVGGGTCFYALHTHAADGIIHIESPVARTFNLGDFFDVWGQSLTPDRVGPIAGPVTTLYDGRVFLGSPRDVPLTAHAQIQLEVGRPLVSPAAVAFPAGS